MVSDADLSNLRDISWKYSNRKKDRAGLIARKDEIEAAYRQRSQEDFLCFQRGLIIPSARGPKLFERCIASFQRQYFEDIAPSLQAVREGTMPPQRRSWLERTKKASKDADLAVCMMWQIAFPLRPIMLQVGAANREQAAIVKTRMTHLLHWNTWLNEYVEVIQSTVRSKKKLASGGPMAQLDILSADVAGAHGPTPDMLVINELSHIKRWEFVENLMDNADGVAQGLAIIATNAGYTGTPAEKWRKNAMTSLNWMVHVLDRPAPWHSQEDLDDARRRNSKSRYDRLWGGKWTSGKGDLMDSGIDKLFTLHGPLSNPEPNCEYITSLDLGVTHDRCGLVILSVNKPLQKLRLAYFREWEPNPTTGEVDLINVEETTLQYYRHFRSNWFFYDPTQAKLMAQRLQRQGVNTREVTFSSPKNLNQMAVALQQAIASQCLELYDDMNGTLQRDLGKIRIVEQSYGYKLEAESDEHGHADVAIALSIALPAALDMLGMQRMLQPDDSIADDDDTPLTEDEINEMPVELRSIYNQDDLAQSQKSKNWWE